MSQAASATASVPSRQPFEPHYREDSTRGEYALSWFEDVIWHDHRICSNCFALLKRDCWMAWEDDDGKRGEADDSWRTTSATLGEDLKESPETVANNKPLAYGRTTCEDCGSVGGLRQHDTLSTDEAVDRVPALITRLRERHYAVDVDEVYDAVRHLKSTDEYTDDDKRVFAVAAALGVEHA